MEDVIYRHIHKKINTLASMRHSTNTLSAKLHINTVQKRYCTSETLLYLHIWCISYTSSNHIHSKASLHLLNGTFAETIVD